MATDKALLLPFVFVSNMIMKIVFIIVFYRNGTTNIDKEYHHNIISINS